MTLAFNRARLGLQCSAASLAIGLFAIPALAQPPADAAADPAEIVVTGSRIPRPQVEASVPIAVLSSQSIENTGQTNIADTLRDLPISGQGISRSSTNFSNFDNGVATVNLRNLGDSRTLVLINGRRSVGIPGDSAVDLNNIPPDLIDHVEIATGGTSAVYGSDAVAGVVNIILKNKFSGVQAHAENRITSRLDGKSPLLSIMGGTGFAGGAGHIVANFTYTNEDGVPSSARDYSRFDSPNFSAYPPQGVFLGNNDNYTFDQAGNVVSYDGSRAQRFNRASERLLTTPVERYIVSALGHYEFSPLADLYAEFSYTKTNARGHIEPLAVDGDGAQGQSVYNFDGSAFPGISTNNPYLPAAILAGEGPDSSLSFLKRSTGIFDRSPIAERDFWRGVVGIKGEVAAGWHYDLSYVHSQVRDDTHNDAILMNNYGAALQATTLGGQIVCADPAARAAGCVPINIFGRQYPYSAAQLKWLTTYAGGVSIPGATIGDSAGTADYLRKSYQDVVSFSLSGSLFQLPAGPVSVAIGAEYHREKAVLKFDPFTASGWTSQQLNGNEVGSYSSKEGFVELEVPILSDKPLIHRLSIEGAARYADYTTVGGVWSYKYGGRYAPTPDISFRAIYARAVRAPNLNELYTPRSNTAQQVVDPCDQAAGAGNDTQGVTFGALPAACLNIPGVAAYLQTHPNFSYSLAQVQTIFGFQSGNANLNAETTNTFTAGMTLTPRFLKNFFLTADYYTIKVKNAIALPDPQNSVRQCFDTGDPNFCNLVSRDANGFITQVDQPYFNAASYEVAGIDVQAHYNFPSRIFDVKEMWSLDLFYNHKFKQQQTAFGGSGTVDELGTADTYASQQLGTGFKDQFTFNLDYQTGPVTLHYQLKYLGPVKALNFPSPDIGIPAYTYHDLQVKVTVGETSKIDLYAGCNNLFDKDPPFIVSGNSQWPGTNTVATTYDLLGRMVYIGAKVNF